MSVVELISLIHSLLMREDLIRVLAREVKITSQITYFLVQSQSKANKSASTNEFL